MRLEKKGEIGLQDKNMVETPEITPEEFFDFIQGMSDEILPFLYEKNKKYKGASFQNGIRALIGNMFRQEDKNLRFKHLVFDWIDRGANSSDFDEPFGESIWDTIRDQLGYAYIGLTICSLYGIGPYKFHEIVDKKNGGTLPHSRKAVEYRESGYADIRSAIESLYLSTQKDPEKFSKALWLEVISFLKGIGDQKFLDEVSDILFLREDL